MSQEDDFYGDSGFNDFYGDLGFDIYKDNDENLVDIPLSSKNSTFNTQIDTRVPTPKAKSKSKKKKERSHLPDYPEGEPYPPAVGKQIPENLVKTDALKSRKSIKEPDYQMFTENYDSSSDDQDFFISTPNISKLIGKAKGLYAKYNDKVTPAQKSIEKKTYKNIHGDLELDYQAILDYIKSNPDIITNIRTAFILQNMRMGRPPGENINTLDNNNFILFLAQILAEDIVDYTFDKYTKEDILEKIEKIRKGETYYGGKRKYKTRKNMKYKTKKVRKTRKHSRKLSRRSRKHKKSNRH